MKTDTKRNGKYEQIYTNKILNQYSKSPHKEKLGDKSGMNLLSAEMGPLSRDSGLDVEALESILNFAGWL